MRSFLLVFLLILSSSLAIARPYDDDRDNLFLRLRGCYTQQRYSPTVIVNAGVRKKAKLNDPQAQETLGEAYLKGTGGPNLKGTEEIKKDYAKASYWFRKSAAQGHNTWQLADLYLKGLGVKQSYVEAYFWAMLDMRNSEQPRCEAVVIIGRAVRQITFAQISEVNKRLAAWKPTSTMAKGHKH